MARVKRQNVAVYRGADTNLRVHVKDDATELVAQDVTGWALSAMIKKTKSDLDVDALITLTSGGGAITIAGVFDADPDINTQRITVAVADTDTDTVQPGAYFWELKRTDAGQEAVICQGIFSLRQSLHRV